MPDRRLTVFTSFSGEGGVERMIVNLVREFVRTGIAVDVLALRGTSRHLEALPPEVGVTHLRGRHSSTVVGELVDYLRDKQPTAMLVAKDRPGRAALRARRRSGVDTRIVIRLGTNLSASLAERSAPSRWLRTTLMRRAYRDAERIIAVSEGVAVDTRRVTGLPDSHIEVIHNPVITSALHAQAALTPEHPWFNDGRRPLLVAAGRLTPQKDFPTLLRAFQRVAQSLPDARLIILGEGRLRAELLSLAAELGIDERLALPGFIANPYPYLARADLFVLSSRWEGSPNVLTEATALGTPVVSTDCPSGPSELLQGGRFGPLVAVGDADALAEAILATIQRPLPRDVLRQAAAEYRADFSARRYLAALFPGYKPPAS